MDNPNWRAVLSMCTEHDPDSRFSGSECKNIEGFCFCGNFKIPKRQFVRGGIKKMQIPSCPRHIRGARGLKLHRVPDLVYADACESTSTLNLDSAAASSGSADQQ
jgi:hypothetical protein